MLKLFPFLDKESRNNLFAKLEDYYNQSEYKYKSLLKYYKKIG